MVVNMVRFTINFDYKDFVEALKKTNTDLRSSGRRVLKRLEEEGVSNFRMAVSKHSKTGKTERNIKGRMREGQWSREIILPASAVFLDSGSRPHAIPMEKANEYAHFYKKTPRQFWGSIYRYGTRAHPFIEEEWNNLMNRTNSIIEDEISKIKRR